jgi:hypothetical protein
MTSKNVVNATVIIEFDNGEYAITGTNNKAVIDICCSLLEFKRLPKNYFRKYSLGEFDIEEEE